MDQDAVVAAVDVVGRSGAKEIEIGYLHDNVPVDEAGWYATARYKGTKVIESDHRGPSEAADALAKRILNGGKCTHCLKTVVLVDSLPGCRWTRMGKRWVRGCEDQQ